MTPFTTGRKSSHVPPGVSSFLFGGQLFPTDLLTKHAFFLGATGSGKSISIEMLLSSALREIGQSPAAGSGAATTANAVIYDAKLDTLSTLAKIGVTAPIIIVNPFDLRSSAWDMARDLTSPVAAYEIASILFPTNPNTSQPFFDLASQALMSGTIKMLHLRSPGDWTFRHVCLLLRSPYFLREFLSQSSHTSYLVDRYLKDDVDSKLTQSILATLDSKMEPYIIIAALWDKAASTFSLRDFITSESVLVIGSMEEAREAIDKLNGVVFHRLSQLLLGQPNSDTRRTYLVWDELREAGKLSGLSSLLLRGRSKGVCVIAGAQDKEGLVEVYGDHVANELLGQFGFRAILKLESPTTAAWAASSFGASEVVDTLGSSSQTFGAERPTQTRGTSQSIRERATLLPGQIMDLPPTSAAAGLHGFYKTPFGAFAAHVDFIPLLPVSTCGALPADFNFQARDEQDQYLEDWRPGELAKFGLRPPNNGGTAAGGSTSPTAPPPTSAELGGAAATAPVGGQPLLPNIRTHPFAGGGVTPIT